MKKFLSLLLVCVLVLGLIPAVGAAEADIREEVLSAATASDLESVRKYLPGLGISSRAVGDNEFYENEPNDSIDTADAIYSDYTITADMGQYDMDYYGFRLTKATNVIIAAASPSSTLMMGLCDSNDEIITAVAGEYDSESGLYTLAIGGILDAGTYYILMIDIEENISDYDYMLYTLHEAHTHSWDSGVQTVAPTYTTTGLKVYTCETCGETKNETIPVVPHTHNYASTTTAATCVDQGRTTHTCGICGHTYRDNYTDALNHVWVDSVCSRCGTDFGDQFADVPKDSYYYESIIWAAGEGITAGDGRFDTFNPEGNCTRGQVVTFLWRSQGKPEPTSTVNPFSDVKETDYFYKAVLWAYEKGITVGISDTEFGPNGICSRAQVVTFLWRSQGKPAPTITTTFSDIPADAYYIEPVAWAVEKEITLGISATEFAPNNNCTRGQIVTFLARTFN